MPIWAPLALAVTTGALVALPVAPALFELHKRRDAAPLPTSRHDGRVANLAEALRSRLEPLRPQLERCRTTREVSRIAFEKMNLLLVGDAGFDFDPSRMQDIHTVMCSADALIPAARVIEADFCADAALEIGESAALRSAIAAGDITLRKKSVVLRWLHSTGAVHLQEGSAAYGRVSAGDCILLEQRCQFERMHAPLILTLAKGDDPTRPGEHESSPRHASAGYARTASKTDHSSLHSRPRIRVEGNFALPDGEIVKANVVATGEARFGHGSQFFGNTKTYKDAVVEENAQVHGSIVCGGRVHIGRGSYVAGPVMAEGDIVMAQGGRVGGPDALTTLSSQNIRIAAGCELHGTVWARTRGVVEE